MSRDLNAADADLAGNARLGIQAIMNRMTKKYRCVGANVVERPVASG